MKLNLISLIIVFASCNFVNAADEKGQARLFIGSTKFDSTELNTELTAQGIKNMDMINQYGVEITFPTFNYLNLGLRYTKHNMLQDELTSNSTTNFEAQIDQDAMMGIARIPFYKNDVVHVDAFAGVGGSNTSYKIKTATQDGELEKKNSLFATPYYAVGTSVAVGYKQYFFIIEVGYESNKVDGFTKSGNINNNISAIDMSGSYLTIGFMFDGIPIHK